MKVNSNNFNDLKSFIKQNSNIITTSQAEKLGFSRMLLSNYTKQGKLVRYGNGIYGLPNEVEDDMYTLMLHSKNIVFSHETALFLNGLSDRTPFVHSVTIPKDKSLSSKVLDNCKCFYVKPELHKLGLIKITNTFGNSIRTYDKERTICDLLKNRKRIDEETFIAAIKNYVAHKDKDINKLFKYAKKINVEDDIRKYMEVLL